MGLRVVTKDLRKVYKTPPPSGVTQRQDERNPGAEVIALNHISLDVFPNEIFGLLGPNGAGKSTAIGILTTRVKPTSGEAWIGDCEVWRNKVVAKRVIGVVQQRPNLDQWLTAREILCFHAAYFGFEPGEREKRAALLLERFQLTSRADHLVNGFSGGMMQRLSVARAMMHDPQVLFLDEPSSSLDTQTRLLLWEIIREYRGLGKTVVISTHNMEEADTLCDRIGIIDHGRVIALGTPLQLKSAVLRTGYVLHLDFAGVPNGMISYLRELPGVSKVNHSGAHVDVYADRGGSLVAPIAAAASTQGVELRDVNISAPSLEDVFLHHTGRSLRQ